MRFAFVLVLPAFLLAPCFATVTGGAPCCSAIDCNNKGTCFRGQCVCFEWATCNDCSQSCDSAAEGDLSIVWPDGCSASCITSVQSARQVCSTQDEAQFVVSFEGGKECTNSSSCSNHGFCDSETNACVCFHPYQCNDCSVECESGICSGQCNGVAVSRMPVVSPTPSSSHVPPITGGSPCNSEGNCNFNGECVDHSCECYHPYTCTDCAKSCNDGGDAVVWPDLCIAACPSVQPVSVTHSVSPSGSPRASGISASPIPVYVPADDEDGATVVLTTISYTALSCISSDQIADQTTSYKLGRCYQNSGESTSTIFDCVDGNILREAIFQSGSCDTGASFEIIAIEYGACRTGSITVESYEWCGACGQSGCSSVSATPSPSTHSSAALPSTWSVAIGTLLVLLVVA